MGKTSLAADAPKPIFLGAESGTDELDVSRFQPSTWFEVQTFLHELLTSNHDYKTLVIDTLDWLEPLLHKHICERYKVASIELAAGGYGKGYIVALKDWQDLKDTFENLRTKRGMIICFLGHSEAVKVADPQLQVDYMRFQLKLHSKASAFWREYVDAVLFATYETFADEDGNKTKALGGERRILLTERRPGWDAKNRFGMPLKMELSWERIVEEVSKSRGETAESIKADIAAIREQLTTDDETSEKMDGYIAKAGDSKKVLRGIVNRLKELLEKQSQTVV